MTPEEHEEIKLCCKSYHSGKSDLVIANRQVSMEAIQLELDTFQGKNCPKDSDVETVMKKNAEKQSSKEH